MGDVTNADFAMHLIQVEPQVN